MEKISINGLVIYGVEISAHLYSKEILERGRLLLQNPWLGDICLDLVHSGSTCLGEEQG